MYPQQVLVELHYITQFNDLVDDYHKQRGRSFGTSAWEFVFEEDIIDLAAHLMDLGYFTAIRDDNIHCNYCTELSLVRINPLCDLALLT